MRTLPERGLALIPLFASLTLLSCGPGRKAVWESKPSATRGSQAASGDTSELLAKAEAAWTERSDKTKLQEAISAWEAAVEAGTTTMEVYTSLARAYYLLADGHIRTAGDEDALLKTHEKGIEYGELAMLASSDEFASKVKGGERVDKSVHLIPNEGQPAMYWYASNLGKFAVAKGFTTTLFYKDRIFAIMQRVLEIDENYYYAAPHRYFGAFYAKAPSFAGGDMGKSKEHFEKAVAMAPEYLGTKVLYADYYATKADNKKLYEELLQSVVSADAEVAPDILAEQQVEVAKAKALLEETSERF